MLVQRWWGGGGWLDRDCDGLCVRVSLFAPWLWPRDGDESVVDGMGFVCASARECVLLLFIAVGCVVCCGWSLVPPLVCGCGCRVFFLDIVSFIFTQFAVCWFPYNNLL